MIESKVAWIFLCCYLENSKHTYFVARQQLCSQEWRVTILLYGTFLLKIEILFYTKHSIGEKNHNWTIHTL